MGESRRGGIIYLSVDGEMQDAKGEFTYNLGYPKRESIIGEDRVHGYTETVQPSFIEGEITDRKTLDLKKLVTAENVTATLVLANGKSVVLREAYYVGEGTGHTKEGNIDLRLESELQAEEI